MRATVFSIITLIVLIVFQPAFVFGLGEPQVEVYLDKETYAYNDWLYLTGVGGATKGDRVLIEISSPSREQVYQESIFIERFGKFVSQIKLSEKQFSELGKYIIKVSEGKNNVYLQFELVSKTIYIPDWIKNVAEFWVNNLINDEEFVDVIEWLIVNQIIIISYEDLGKTTQSVAIPEWVKTTTEFWIDQKISDQTFASALQYLISVGIITVPPPEIPTK